MLSKLAAGGGGAGREGRGKEGMQVVRQPLGRGPEFRWGCALLGEDQTVAVGATQRHLNFEGQELPGCLWLDLPAPSLHISAGAMQDTGLKLLIGRAASKVRAAVRGSPPNPVHLNCLPQLADSRYVLFRRKGTKIIPQTSHIGLEILTDYQSIHIFP